MEIKKAEMSDLNQILSIIQKAKNKLKKENVLEWPTGYDTRKQVLNDISRENKYIVIKNKETIATFTLLQSFPRALFGPTKNKQTILPLIITNIVISQKRKMKLVFEKIIEFTEKKAKEKNINEIYFKEIMYCDECENIFEKNGFEKTKEINSRNVSSSKFLCYKKIIK